MWTARILEAGFGNWIWWHSTHPVKIPWVLHILSLILPCPSHPSLLILSWILRNSLPWKSYIISWTVICKTNRRCSWSNFKHFSLEGLLHRLQHFKQKCLPLFNGLHFLIISQRFWRFKEKRSACKPWKESTDNYIHVMIFCIRWFTMHSLEIFS